MYPTAEFLAQWTCRGATDLPFWDTRKQSAESGVYCSACGLHFKRSAAMYSRGRGRRTPRAYTLHTITRYFARCVYVERPYKLGEDYRVGRPVGAGPHFLVDENGESIQVE